MMIVFNCSLCLLILDELCQYGLDGINVVQDDLEWIKQMCVCGDDFVQCKDVFLVVFDQQCKCEGVDMELINSCGQVLKQCFGFLDVVCFDESLLLEIDVVMLLLVLLELLLVVEQVLVEIGILVVQVDVVVVEGNVFVC